MFSETISTKGRKAKSGNKRSKTKSKKLKKIRNKEAIIQRRTCDLTIVADHLFFRQVGEGSVEKTVLQMLWHVKVSFISVRNV